MSNKIRQLYIFGDFRLDAEQLSLWQNDELVSVPPKALQILKLLIEKQGEIVSREELLEKVWHETFVEEANINYTVSLLRKALGDNKFVQTVSKRGYRFVAEVTIISADSDISNSQDSIITPKIVAKKTRWIFASIFILVLISLTTYAFWGRNDKTSSANQVPNSNEAKQAYTRGKMILEDKDTPKRNEKAIDEFQKSITLDPTFALGYSGLAEGFAAQGKRLSNQESLEYYSKAKAAAQKALNLDENSAEAYSILGWIKFIGDWDWSGAENDLKRAIQLKPNDAFAHYRYSQLLTAIGNNTEALEEIKKASEIDPISEFILTGNFIILEQGGNFVEAGNLAEKYWRENKENHSALRAFASSLFNQGEYKKVIEIGENYLEKNKKQIPWLSLLAT
ncbi:MAG TPA: winged helix-turn-helix domain-containing protein, partial [Pyrinomonadaceae bacterium]|nr:winged helix-turn-helix domain-containing protein [Pyrinomonadaceae bacterium]